MASGWEERREWQLGFTGAINQGATLGAGSASYLSAALGASPDGFVAPGTAVVAGSLAGSFTIHQHWYIIASSTAGTITASRARARSRFLNCPPQRML